MDNAWAQLARFSSAPSATLVDQQWQWLSACLARHAHSEYGRQHHFASIRSVEDYQDNVPLVSYQQVSPYITRIAAGEADVLFAGLPVAFEQTGGSSGGEKLIPYTQASLLDFRRALLPWLSESIQHYDIRSGSAYWSISPATRQPKNTAAGISIGLTDAAYLGEEVLHPFATLSAVPFEVAGIADINDWYRMSLYHLIRRVDLSLVSVWSPTFLLQLINHIEQDADALRQLLYQGGDVAGFQLTEDLAAYARLQAYLNTGRTQTLWPQLTLVSCWSDASSSYYFKALQAKLPHVHFQAKGLLATEAVVTIPDAKGQTCLATHCGFYEFLDHAGQVHTAEQLVKDQRYELVITTNGGLYRYRLGDSVMCLGWSDERPILKFMGRIGITSDLVGEKLCDDFVGRSFADIPGFVMLFPCAAEQSYYHLVLDETVATNMEYYAQMVETQLQRNPQYAYARKLSQLGPLRCSAVSRGLERYTHWRVQQGQRLGDVKTPYLCLDQDCLQYLLDAA